MASVYLKPPEFTGEAVPVTVAAEVMAKIRSLYESL